MSADNGVYILITAKEDSHGCEFRVVHCQNIEDLYWDTEANREADEIQPAMLKEKFGRATVFEDQDAARNEAFQLASDIEAGGVLEYGVREIHHDEPFPK